MGQLISAAILVTFVGSALMYSAQESPDASADRVESMSPSTWEYIDADTENPSDTTGCAYNYQVMPADLVRR